MGERSQKAAKRGQPWLRSTSEGHVARKDRHVTTAEVVLAVVVILAIVAYAVWFFTISSGGIGPGSM